MSVKKKDVLSVVAAAEVGDQLAELKAMRVLVAKKILDPETSGTALAALTRRQIEIGNEVRELEAGLPAEKKGSVSGENVVNAEAKFRPEAI